MSEPSAETAQPEGAYTAQEWGVRYGSSERVHSQGTGYWAMRHAEQEVERVKHNAGLPFVGQPRSAEVVQRTVTTYYHASPWESREVATPPAGGESHE